MCDRSNPILEQGKRLWTAFVACPVGSPEEDRAYTAYEAWRKANQPYDKQARSEAIQAYLAAGRPFCGERHA